MNRLTGPALAILLTLAGVLAGDLRAQTWAAWRGFTNQALPIVPAGDPTTPQTRKVIVLLVRGLRLSTARSMPTLDALRKRGADVTLELSAPTYRVPVWLSLFSGARADTHGALTNDALPNPTLDTIFSRMAAAGNASVIIGAPLWNTLFGAAVQRIETLDDTGARDHDDRVVNALLQTLTDPAAPERLIVAEFTLLDTPARDPAAASATDIRIKAVANAADLANNTLLVLSDRGLTAAGGEGGTEPEVARVPLIFAGAGISQDTQDIARPMDVAPTLALLLGVPIPVHAQGAPIWEALQSRDAIARDGIAHEGAQFTASARQLTAFYEGWSEATRQPRFAAELLQIYSSDIALGDRARFGIWLAALNQAATGAAQGRLAADRLARAPLVLGLGLLLIACALVALNSGLAPALAGAAVTLTGWWIHLNWVRGITPSLSLFPAGDPTVFLDMLARDASLLFLAGCAVAALLAARLCASGWDALAAVLGALALPCCTLAARYGWFYYRFGDVFDKTPPDAPALLDALIALTQAGALNVTVLPVLPALPLALLAGVFAAMAWAVFGRRST